MLLRRLEYSCFIWRRCNPLSFLALCLRPDSTLAFNSSMFSRMKWRYFSCSVFFLRIRNSCFTVVELGKYEKDFVQFVLGMFEFVEAQLDLVWLLFFVIGLRASFWSDIVLWIIFFGRSVCGFYSHFTVNGSRLFIIAKHGFKQE